MVVNGYSLCQLGSYQSSYMELQRLPMLGHDVATIGAVAYQSSPRGRHVVGRNPFQRLMM